jgi:hypothetical protein
MVIILDQYNSPGGAILIWSYINYKVLTGGKDKHKAS